VADSKALLSFSDWLYGDPNNFYQNKSIPSGTQPKDAYLSYLRAKIGGASTVSYAGRSFDLSSPDGASGLLAKLDVKVAPDVAFPALAPQMNAAAQRKELAAANKAAAAAGGTPSVPAAGTPAAEPGLSAPGTFAFSTQDSALATAMDAGSAAQKLGLQLDISATDIEAGPAREFPTGGHVRTVEPQTGAFTNYSEGHITDLYKKFLTASPADVLKIQKKMLAAGLLNSIDQPGLPEGTQGKYMDLLQLVAIQNAAGQNLTPDQLLDRMARANAAGIAGGSAGGVSTSSSSRVTTTSAGDARAILTQQFQQDHGRAPSEQEIATFTSALNTYQEAHPATSSSTTDRRGHTTVSESDRATLSPAGAAQNFAESGQLGIEANTYMAGTQYYKAAIGALGAAVNTSASSGGA
jgi:hypothetical protein